MIFLLVKLIHVHMFFTYSFQLHTVGGRVRKRLRESSH